MALSVQIGKLFEVIVTSFNSHPERNCAKTLIACATQVFFWFNSGVIATVLQCKYLMELYAKHDSDENRGRITAQHVPFKTLCNS